MFDEARASPGVATDLILTLRSNEYLQVSRHTICDRQDTATGAHKTAHAHARIQSLEDQVQRLQHQGQSLEVQNRALEDNLDEHTQELFGVYQENDKLQHAKQGLEANIENIKADYERKLNGQRTMLGRLSERLERLKGMQSENERVRSVEKEREYLRMVLVECKLKEQEYKRKGQEQERRNQQQERKTQEQQEQIAYWKAEFEALEAKDELQARQGLLSTTKGFLGA